ncbi:SNF2 family N-terminal domain-containing protein [Mycena floridula]|nr:SNF2 family N-terminal domain-containing protein [Mycena floridula]
MHNSYEEQQQAMKNMALDQLRNRKQNTSSASSSYQPHYANQMAYSQPPQQSRDATMSSRFFTPSEFDNYILPNSSGLTLDNTPPFSYGSQGGQPDQSNFLGSWDQPSSMSSFDPLSASSGFHHMGQQSHSQSQSLRRSYGGDDDQGPPRKRPHIEDPSLSVFNSPPSPDIQRAGVRRRPANPSDEFMSMASSLDDFQQHSSQFAPQRPRIVRGDDPMSLDKFTRFRFTMPGEPEDRLRAAWRQARGDVRAATLLIADSTWSHSTVSDFSRYQATRPGINPAFLKAVWDKAQGDPQMADQILKNRETPPQPTMLPREVTGRVTEIDQATRAQRAAEKEKAKRSMIYTNNNRASRPNNLATPNYRNSTPSSMNYSHSAASSPATPAPRARRRIKKMILDSDSDELQLSDDSDEEGGSRGTSRPRQDNPDGMRALHYFNTKGPEALQELTGCSVEQAKTIISLRPFESIDDLNTKLGQGKKKAGPAGISPRMFLDSTGIFEGYGTVDRILEDCEDIGAELRTAIASWSAIDEVKAKSDIAIPKDELDDGALSLRTIAPLKDPQSKGFIDKQPSLLSEDITLKEYQLLGVNWLHLLYRKKMSCILADEMGLGKTIQVIAFFAYLKEKGNNGPHLVVVPSSTLENWLREFDRFAPTLNVRSYYGSKDARVDLREDLLQTRGDKNSGGWDVLVTTYNLAQGESDRKFFRRIEWHACVFDEGHILKNFQSQRYQTLLKVESKWRLLLTGTPLQNNLQELVSLMNFILPEHFSDALESLRAIFKVKGDSKVSLLAQERVSRAKKMMTPFVLRRRKDQVLKDLPNKTERIEWCEMTGLQQKIYQDTVQRSRKTVLEMDTPSAESTDAPLPLQRTKGKKPKNPRPKEKVYLENSSNVLMDLRKAASHPMLFRTLFTDEILTGMTKQLMKEPDFKKRGAVAELVREDMTVMTDSELQVFCGSYKSIQKYTQDEKCYVDSGKIQVLLKLFKEYFAQGRKVLVFSQFTQILDILQAILKQRDINYLILTGSTAVDIRQSLVDEFTEDETLKVFLLSTKAGGMGINLTAASVVIMFDQDFNPHNDRQAQDRAYRIGQKRDVDVVKLITRGTIEEHMLRLGETKLLLDEAVAGEGEEEVGESAPEREMKKSLMHTLRQQFELDRSGATTPATPAT